MQLLLHLNNCPDSNIFFRCTLSHLAVLGEYSFPVIFVTSANSVNLFECADILSVTSLMCVTVSNEARVSACLRVRERERAESDGNRATVCV